MLKNMLCRSAQAFAVLPRGPAGLPSSKPYCPSHCQTDGMLRRALQLQLCIGSIANAHVHQPGLQASRHRTERAQLVQAAHIQLCCHGTNAAHGSNMQPTELLAVAAHAGRATSVCLCNRGSILAVSGGSDATVKVWSARDQVTEPLAVLWPSFYSTLRFCSVCNVPAFVIAAWLSHKTGILRYSRLSMVRACMQCFRGHTSAVCSLALDADETLAAAGATDGTIRLFDLGTGCGAGACSPWRAL